MKLAEILELVAGSGRDDWKVVGHHVLAEWSFSESNPGGDQRVTELEPRHHHTYAVHRGDIDISLAMGLVHREDYHAPWMPDPSPFADGSISSCWVHLRYRGQIVAQWVMVFLDGARYAIPSPDCAPGGQSWFVPTDKARLGRLFASFLVPGDRGNEMDEALRLCRLAVQ